MEKNRVFSIVDRDCPNVRTGGGGGVNFRLYLANKKYPKFENIFFIFDDKVMEKDSERTFPFNKEGMNDTSILKIYFSKLDEHYHFNEKDVFIFHDILSAYVFYTQFHLNRTILVYHQQGTIYREYEYITGLKNLKYKESWDNLMMTVINQMRYIAFPSKRAMESVIESDECFREVIGNADVKILYNGCDCDKNLSPVSDIAKNIIETINENAVPSFISVATLNVAKGVERIPEYLAKIKEQYGEILWIVIGDGVQAEELKKNINKYGLNDNTLWLSNRIANEDLMAIYQYTDFYILAHRFSIFDYATIEAMHYGNIPVLTPVGGNKEMIEDNSGIFINDLASTKEFDEFMEQEDVNVAREKNIQLAEEKFGEESFISAYAELVHSLIEE